jgi:hypothetical protein
LFSGSLLSALEFVDLGLQPFEFQSLRLSWVRRQLFCSPSLSLQPLRLTPFGFASLDIQPVRLDALLAAALPLQPLYLRRGGPALGLETFGVGSLGAFGSKLVGRVALGCAPFGLTA